MLNMKKVLRPLFIALLCVFSSALLFSCNKEVTSTYVMQDGKTTYTLTLNETKQTFLLEEEGEEGKKETEGKYTVKDGSFILESTGFGYRAIRLVGDSFLFIANPSGMEEIQPPCEHDWDDGKHTPGNCRTYGYVLYTCRKCKETKKVTDTEYGGHVLDEGRHYSGKTCSDYGYTVFTCTICGGYTETVKDTEYTDNHLYEPTETVQDSGCKQVLKRLYRCSRCEAAKYLVEDSRAIGSHDYDEETGICKTCGHLKNGLPAVHEYKNDEEYCYHCGVKKSVLEGVAAQPCGYHEDGVVYIGVYPQKIASQSAKEIKANGLYDSALDCWYYGHETYVIRKAEERMDIDKAFSSGEKIVAGEWYAFVLQPLAFVQEGDKYVCDAAIDAAPFVKGYAELNGETTNVWENCTLHPYVSENIKNRIAAEEVASVDLLTEAELPTRRIKRVTDYALAGGLSFIESDGLRVGKWYLKTPADVSSGVKCVGYDGQVESASVTSIRGIVPVVRLGQGE